MMESVIRQFNPSVCYDIGAHDGKFAEMLRRLLPKAEIHQFEGSPKKAQKVKVGPWHKVVLSDKDDAEVVFYHDGGTGDTYMRETDQFLKTNYQTTTVKTRRLDTYVDENFLPYPDFIKIDVQGAELDVLVGCNDILNRCKLIHCEIPAEGIEFNSGSPSQKEYLDFFKNAGFIHTKHIKDHLRDKKLVIQHDYFFSKEPLE